MLPLDREKLRAAVVVDPGPSCARSLSARDHLLVRLVLLEGLTLAEAHRLRIEDVRGDVLTVEDTRAVPRTETLASELASLISAVAAGRTAGQLFITVTGTPVHLDQARRILLTAAHRAGLEERSLQRVRAHLLHAA